MKRNAREEKIVQVFTCRTPLEVKLSDELSGNLKNLKPEGNLYYDQMLSLQSSGKIEPECLLTRKGSILKITENGLTKISSKVEFFSYTCCFHFVGGLWSFQVSINKLFYSLSFSFNLYHSNIHMLSSFQRLIPTSLIFLLST